MRLIGKCILTVIVHMVWFVSAFMIAMLDGASYSRLYNFLAGTFMNLVIYPLVFNAFVLLIYKVRPLEKLSDKKKYFYFSLSLTLILIIYMVMCWL